MILNNLFILFLSPLPTDVSLPNVCANGPADMDAIKVMSQHASQQSQHPSQQQPHPQHPSLHGNPSLQAPAYQPNPGIGIGQLNPSKVPPQYCHT